MKVLLAGGSGLIGTALGRALAGAGHPTRRLVRRPPSAAGEFQWDPAGRRMDPAALVGIDAVVNLSGENIGAGRWTAARCDRIFRSRVDATRTLVDAIQQAKARPSVFVCASATGYYGDRGDEILTEKSALGQGFLPGVCLAWETHAGGAAAAGVRTALLRFGVVVAREGGALARMIPVFRLGLGGRLGSGCQWMPWIGSDDVVRAIMHVLAGPRCEGPYNVTSPRPVTNAEFTRALASALGRRARLPVPVWALRLALGRMADEALLASTRATPDRLSREGFVFKHPAIENAISHALQRRAV